MRPLRAAGAVLVALALLPAPSAVAAAQYDPPSYFIYEDETFSRRVSLAECRLRLECRNIRSHKLGPCPDRRHLACYYKFEARMPKEAPLRSRFGAARRT